MRRELLLLPTIILIIGQPQHPVDAATIAKCCRIGDLLTATLECEPNMGSHNKWAPRVFMPKRGTFHNETGTLPAWLQVQEDVKPKHCQKLDIFSTADIYLFGNGSLYLFHKHSFIHDPVDFCVDERYALGCRNMDLQQQQSGGGNGTGNGSIPDNMTRAELNKCCGPNQVYLTDNATCAAIPTANSSTFKTNTHSDKKFQLNDANFELTYKFPDCTTNEIAIAGSFNESNFNASSGELRISQKKVFAKNEFCLDHVWKKDRGDDGVAVFVCSNHFMIPSSPTSHHHQNEATRLSIYPYGLLISVVFLCVTLAIGSLLKSNHHLLHFRTQTNYVICLLVGDLLLAITQLSGNSISGIWCVLIAHVMHFAFLATFFWLNTMCFNIWWTFRDFRPTSVERTQEMFRLRMYELYAWGLPIIITFVGVFFDNFPAAADNERFIRPRFGERKCWFYGHQEIFAYFFAPIGTLLCFNVILFISTARQLTCGLWKKDDVKSTSERVAIGRVCLKLTVLMGVTWILDVLSWALDYKGPDFIWFVSDIINSCQGLFIFIVVGCQPQVWSALRRMRSDDQRMTGTTHGNQHSTSSQGGVQSIECANNSTTNNATPAKKTALPVDTTPC